MHHTFRRRLPARTPLVSVLLASAVLACRADVVVPGEDVPASIAIVVAPTATVLTGALIVPQPVVELRNAEGEAIRRAGVTVTVSASAGTLRGTTSVLTDAEGRATFAGLSLTGQEGPAELRFACCNLPPARQAVSLSFGEIPLVAASTTTAEGRAGTEMVPGPSVRLNTSALGDGVVIEFELAGPGSIPQLTAITNAEGVAQLPSFRFGETPGTSILTATIQGTDHRVEFQLTSKLAGTVTIRDEGFAYAGQTGKPFTLPVIEVTDGSTPLPGVEVRIRTLSDQFAPVVTRVTDAAGRIEDLSLPLSSAPMENVFEVFAVGYMPAPVNLTVMGVDYVASQLPLRFVTSLPADVMPLENSAGLTFVSVQVVNAAGTPVPDVRIMFPGDESNGTVAWWTILGPEWMGPFYTDENGFAVLGWQVPTAPGSYAITIASPSVAEPITFTAIRGE